VTYVVGIKRCGAAAIITDSLLTSAAYPPDIASIKSGVLFPGCIYGICGNWQTAWQCIRAIRAGCTQETTRERFEELARLIARYPFPLGNYNAFEILLSSRHTGAPDFYLIQSETGHMHPVVGDLFTLGSGRQLLNDMLIPYSETLGSDEGLQKLRRQYVAIGHQLLDEDFAHLYAFLIFQSTHGDMGQQLARLGAGGFVHFIFQDGQGERRQKPRLYMVGSCDKHGHVTGIWAERLAFDHDPVFGDLIVIVELGGRDGLPKPKWSVVVQNKTGRDQAIDDWRAWVAAIEDRQRAAPLYEILIAGRVDFKRRGVREVGYPTFLDTWNGTPALDLEGRMQLPLLEFLKQHT
jgi:hypothetical protein